MSEADPGLPPEKTSLDHLEATEPDRLPPPNAAHAACEPIEDEDSTLEDDSDVELADEDGPETNLSGADQ